MEYTTHIRGQHVRWIGNDGYSNHGTFLTLSNHIKPLCVVIDIYGKEYKLDGDFLEWYHPSDYALRDI